jgi:hypothetical protein
MLMPVGRPGRVGRDTVGGGFLAEVGGPTFGAVAAATTGLVDEVADGAVDACSGPNWR